MASSWKEAGCHCLSRNLGLRGAALAPHSNGIDGLLVLKGAALAPGTTGSPQTCVQAALFGVKPAAGPEAACAQTARRLVCLHSRSSRAATAAPVAPLARRRWLLRR